MGKVANNVKAQLKCYHCGDPCKTVIQEDDKHFCCIGCQTVYHILEEHDLCDYYSLEQFPGARRLDQLDIDQYDYLSNDAIVEQLLDFKSENLHKVSFHIPQIHCSSCIWLLEHLHTIQEGIIQSRVNFVKRRLSIDYDPSKIQLKELVILLAQLSYEPVIRLSDKEEKPARKFGTAVIKLGVAGFCFGNIMLLSFPEYLGISDVESPSIIRFINIVNLLLAIPVVTYCSYEYYHTAFSGLRHRFINIDVPIVIGIITLFTWSVYEISIGQSGYFDSLAGLLFFLLLGKWYQRRTYDHLSFERNYKSYFPIGITRTDGVNRESVPVLDLQPGDQILVRHQEVIPADSLLLSESASVDYSFVTGESNPIKVNRGQQVYAGGRQMGETINLEVQKKVSHSYLTELWNAETFNKREEDEFSSLINQVAQYFTPIVLILAALTAVYWSIVDSTRAVQAFSAVLIVACPCALALATPFTLGTALSLMGKHGLYLKNANIVEKLSKIKQLIFDKTGTLTSPGSANISWSTPLNDATASLVYSLAIHSVHPLSKMVASGLEQTSEFTVHELKQFAEFPGKGIQGMVGCHLVKMGSSTFVGFEAVSPEEQTSNLYVSIDGVVVASARLDTHYREGVADIIRDLGEQYELSLLSGDTPKDMDSLKKIFPKESRLLFQQSPSDKLDFVAHAQGLGEVLMIGDGLNDAGALKQSDVGIALTEDVANFTPASDGILEARAFPQLTRFITLARKAKGVIIISFIISFMYNIVGLSLAMNGLLQPVYAAILMPLSSVSIVLFTTLAVRFWGYRLQLR